MRPLLHSVLFLTQLSLILGALPFIPYKCWIWDSPCLTARAQSIVPTFTVGIPELGTERLDPMFIDSSYVNDDGFLLSMRNIQLDGLRNAVIDKLSVDMNSKIMHLVFHADHSIKSIYSARGKLLSLPISGDGELTVRYNNVLTDMIIPFEIIKDIKGRNIIDLKGYKYWYDVRGGAQYRFGNLYYGNELSSEAMHTVLHRNWKYLTNKYGRQLYDKVNDKVFNAIRSYLRSQPVDAIAFY